MNNETDLKVSRSLELLGNLKRTTSEFAKKEEQIARELSNRRYAVSRKYWDAMEKADAALAAETTAAESNFSSDEERIKPLHEKRGARIQHAQTIAVRNLPKRVHEARGEWLGNLQVRQLDAERTQEAGLRAADQTFAAFAPKLAEQWAALTNLERLARSAMLGYPGFMRLLRNMRNTPPEVKTEAVDQSQLFEDLRAHLQQAGEQIQAFGRLPFPKLFKYLPFPALAMLAVSCGVVLAWALGFNTAAWVTGSVCGIGLLGAFYAVYRTGFGKSKPVADAVFAELTEARRSHEACGVASATRRAVERERVKQEFERVSAEIQGQWNRAGEIQAEFEKKARAKLEAQVPRITAKNEELLQARLKRIAATRDSRLERSKSEAESIRESATKTHESEMAALVSDEKAKWDELETAWKGETTPVYQDIEAMNAASAERFPAWNGQFVEAWKPPMEFSPAIRFGHLDFDLAKQVEALPKDPRLALPGPSQITLPLALTFPTHGSLLFETNESAGKHVIGTLNNVILRLLAKTPPGKISFTIIDPIGLGENFAGFMHLSDYEESIINRRIWTQRDQIEERLAELNDHIEKVIQMYLRNEYATIAEYNAQAGSVAEKYHFLVVADFPANFSDVAAKRLQSIAVSGARCGIYTFIHWDQRQQLPDGFSPDELRKNSVCLSRKNNVFTLANEHGAEGTVLVFDEPPDDELAANLIHKIGKSSIDSNRVEVPFSQIAPKPAEMWKNETTSEMKIAIGRTGATKLQYLAVGKGTRQHALFAGKTGSGKSTLFHVIITNLALACSPDQVEFYLVDFKKGVEFKCYATKHLPHAKVIAIESDREFALSVLERVDQELKRRGDLFRKLGVQDIAGYKRAGGTEPVPRSLLIIDEFQEFFVEDDTIAQTASLLFDRIVRQGRAFGIHVFLGSQSLGGAYSLARATIGQMVIRVALQCNEADAYLIMDDTNSAPRLLSRPGEGIYNDSGGAVAGNSPFQVVWLPDQERDAWLDKVSDIAKQNHDRHPRPLVFEGNAPADIRENELLSSVLDAPAATPPSAGRCWLGAPNSIKGPTEAVFHRQSGNNLLIVGQRDEAAVTMLGLSLLALAAQYPVGGAKFYLFNSTNPGSSDSEFLDRIVEAIPHEVTVLRGQQVAETMSEIATEMKARSSNEHSFDTHPVFVFIHGLHKFKKLRHEDDFSFSSGDDAGSNPGAQLNDLMCEGSSLGMHIITTLDTFNNVGRCISRKALSEFEMRVVFQMSANDSASLIDSPKAGNLGLHRALFYNEHEGTLETFRPYATPDPGWIGEAAEKLNRLRGNLV